MLYAGYCYGWWGRSNLVLQYLFQCHSPPGSEQVRYAEFRVLAPACRWPEVEAMSADGRYLLITEHAAPATTYRLDLTTGKRSGMTLTNAPWTAYRFLSDDVVLAHERASRYVLIDAQTGRQVPVRWQYTDQLTLQSLATLRTATQIIIVGTAAVALAPDPFRHPDQNLVLYSTVLSQPKLQKQLLAANITTPIIHPAAPYGRPTGANGITARHGQLWADRLGIHPAGTPTAGAGVVLLRPTNLGYNPDNAAFSYFAIGWTADDQAVVYASPTRYLVEHWALTLAPVDYFPVPQPVLLLQAPQDSE
jgi:hypothetical protein